MTKQKKQSSEAAVREIRRRTRRKFSPEEKIRIVPHCNSRERDSGFRGSGCTLPSDSRCGAPALLPYYLL